MPHIIVEYAQNLAGDRDIQTLCQDIFDEIARHKTFPDPSAIKVRALAYRHYIQALDNDRFVHATIKLLPGRDDATKKELTTALHALLRERLPEAASHSVDIEDLSSAYVKSAR